MHNISVFLMRWITGAVSLRRGAVPPTEDVRRTTGRGGQQGGVPDRASRCRALGKRGQPRSAPETETKMRNFSRFSPREMLYIRAFCFALSRFSTTFAVRFISPFMRMPYKRRPSRALSRPEKTTPAIYPTSSSTI